MGMLQYKTTLNRYFSLITWRNLRLRGTLNVTK